VHAGGLPRSAADAGGVPLPDPQAAQRAGIETTADKLYKPPIPTQEQIDDFFRGSTQRSFPVEGRLVWTYAFTHWSERKLLELRWRLEDLGYAYCGTTDASARERDAVPLFRLCVSEERHHTPASLHERLTDLSQLAIASDVDYEGWEAAKLPH
jgi:hypothetical protein